MVDYTYQNKFANINLDQLHLTIKEQISSLIGLTYHSEPNIIIAHFENELTQAEKDILDKILKGE